jgi:S-layer homology domain.
MKRLLLTVLIAISLVATQISFTPQIASAASESSKVLALDMSSIKEEITSIKDDLVEKAKELFNKLKDVKDHWAAEAIQKAIERGYVNGYEDLTFRPNAQVSRAEFIKMVVAAIGLDTSNVPQGSKWYDPYINAAIYNNLISTKEYESGDYNTPMTRMEMARLSVRAIGLTASSDAEYMYLATKNGLISGVGDGKLAENETTTRAQAVTIIERILKVRNGEKLPVDDKAVANAEQAMNAPKDPWGRKIRTTNLPKNYKDFPYILEDIPNEMYEMEVKYVLNDGMSALEVSQLKEYNIESVTRWANLVKQWGTQVLNVNYETIGDEWAEKLKEVILQQGSQVNTNVQKYVEWVKKNEIQIEGEIRPEPSIVLYGDADFYVRSYFRFKINHYKEDKDTIIDGWYKPGKYKKGVWYEGYADIPLSTKVRNGTLDHYFVSPMASFFHKGIVREMK